jgi:hypothetical protein
LSDAGGAAPADGGASGEAAPAEAAAPAVDLGPITSFMQELGGKIDSFEARLPQPEAPTEADAWDFGDVTWGEEPAAEPEPAQPQFDPQQFAQKMQGATQQEIQKALSEALSPVHEQLSNYQADADAEYLTTNFPEFADDEFAQNMIAYADQRAAQMGLPPGTSRTAAFLEDTYKAQKYDQMARGEVPVGDLTHNDLEGGSGAVPGGRQEVDTAQQILDAGGKKSFW